MQSLNFTKNQKLALCAIIGLMVIALSIKLARNSLSTGSEVVLHEPSHGSSAGIVTSDSDRMYGRDEKVVFQVAGEVVSPGVYSLPKGSRIIDAVKSAGGAKPDADLESMNLAERISDGSRIYVASKQPMGNGVSLPPMQTQASASSSNTPTSSGSKSRSTGSGKLKTPGEGIVHLNSADASELQRLPGVGPATAQKIVEYRTQIGRFTSPEQITEVKGIGPKKLEKMRPFLGL